MWGLLLFLIGLIYGWVTPGRSQGGRLLMNGLWIGLILGLVLALIGAMYNAPPLYAGAGILAVVINVFILTLLFVLGAWIGDLIEGGRQRKTRYA